MWCVSLKIERHFYIWNENRARHVWDFRVSKKDRKKKRKKKKKQRKKKRHAKQSQCLVNRTTVESRGLLFSVLLNAVPARKALSRLNYRVPLKGPFSTARDVVSLISLNFSRASTCTRVPRRWGLPRYEREARLFPDWQGKRTQSHEERLGEELERPWWGADTCRRRSRNRAWNNRRVGWQKIGKLTQTGLTNSRARRPGHAGRIIRVFPDPFIRIPADLTRVRLPSQ